MHLIEDLHGNTFKREDTNTSPFYPSNFTKDGRLIFNRDIISDTGFNLVRFNKGTFGYVFYVNSLYVYGTLQLIKYNKNKDIRYHVK